MTFEQFQALFAPEIPKLVQRLETGVLNTQQAEVITTLFKNNPTPSSSIGELLPDSKQNPESDLAVFTGLLFEVVAERRKL